MRPASDLQHAEKLLDEGLSYYRVARIMGCSRYFLQTHFPGKGVHRPGVQADDESRIEDWLDQGMSYREIARRLGVGEGAIRRRFPGRSKHKLVRLTEGQVRQAQMLLDDGASYREVARTIGCSDWAVGLRFPGRGWTEETRIEHVRALRDLTSGHRIWGGREDRRHIWGRRVDAVNIGDES